MSLMPTGTPCSGPRGRAASRARASASAWSGSSQAQALTVASRLAMRARQEATASSEVVRPSAIARAGLGGAGGHQPSRNASIRRLLLATVDLDHRAVDEMRQRRGEIGDQIGDLVAFGDAAERDGARGEPVGLLVGDLHVARHRAHQPVPAFGPHRSRVDRADGDVLAPVLGGDRHGEVLAGGIGGAGRDLPVGVLDAVIADQVDDAPAALAAHMRHGVAGAAHIAHEFELQRGLPIRLRQAFEDAAGGGAGVVDQDVEPAEMRDRAVDERLGVLRLGQIGGDRQGFLAGALLDRGRGVVEPLLVARADRHLAALARQGLGDRPADADAAPRDRRDLAVQLKIHLRLLVPRACAYGLA